MGISAPLCKGDAEFLAYQKAKNSGATEEEIKEVMMIKAIEVGFMSTHSSPKYDELNAVDIPYVTMRLSVKQQEELKAAIKEQNNAIIIRVENGVFHIEIPQPVK